MTFVFPDNTPVYIQLKYLYHAGVYSEQLTIDNFTDYLYKDAYWYGVSNCPTAIKLQWLEMQNWSKALFEEQKLPDDYADIKLYKPAEIFYNIRKDLANKYSHDVKHGLSGYLFDIYFGDSSEHYYASMVERDYLSQHSSVLISRINDFEFCNAFYLIYVHKAKDILKTDIDTEEGQRHFIAFLFVYSSIWFDRIGYRTIYSFIGNNLPYLLDSIKLLLQSQKVNGSKSWAREDVIDYLISFQDNYAIHQVLQNYLLDYRRAGIVVPEYNMTRDRDASLFESFLYSSDHLFIERKKDVIELFAVGNNNREPVIIQCSKSYMKQHANNCFNAHVEEKVLLSENINSINPELLQYFIENGSSYSPLEIYAPVENFRLYEKYDEPQAKNTVSVVGFSRSEIGTGEDARNTVKALSANNRSVSVFNILPDGVTYKNQENSVQMYEKHQLGYFQIYTMPPAIYMSYYLSSPAIHDAAGYKIGYFAWEFQEWKKEYDVVFSLFDEIWVISKFLLSAFKGNNIPVMYVPPVVTLSGEPFSDYDALADLGLPKEKFLFLFVFDIKSGLARKNPIAVIKGFLAAFPEDDSVGLVLKFSFDEYDYENNRELFSLIEEDKRIQLVSDVLKKSQIESLIHQCDAVVSLHRSEGFGRIMAEAMLLKTLVICTGYSGNMDFCNNDTALLVDYELIEVGPGEYPFAEGLVWADVKSESVIEQMIKARTDVEGNAQKIESAYKLMVENHSLQTAALVMAQRLDDLRLL